MCDMFFVVLFFPSFMSSCSCVSHHHLSLCRPLVDRKTAGFNYTFSELEALGKANSSNYRDAKIEYCFRFCSLCFCRPKNVACG
jgi:hypothetical protein